MPYKIAVALMSCEDRGKNSGYMRWLEIVEKNPREEKECHGKELWKSDYKFPRLFS